MATWATLGPILPGKEDEPRRVGEYLRSHRDEYDESRRRAGITMERVYQMSTPMGEVIIAYQEGEGFENANRSLAKSDLAIDQWFLNKLREVHGFDLAEAPPPSPQQILSYVDSAAGPQRKRGLAFCAPLLPGKLEGLRRVFDQAQGARLSEMQESRRALGITRDCAYLNRTPMGDIVCVYIEGDDPVAGNRRFAASQSPFDTWFKQEAGDAFGIDFNQPLPPITQILDRQLAGTAAR